jgi:hypothetical protein
MWRERGFRKEGRYSDYKKGADTPLQTFQSAVFHKNDNRPFFAQLAHISHEEFILLFRELVRPPEADKPQAGCRKAST